MNKEAIEQKRKEEYAKQVVLHNDKEIHVTDFNNQSITSSQLTEYRMNSYARDKIFPKLKTEALVKEAEYYQSQSGLYQYPAGTYNEALIHVIVPELINRIKELEEKLAKQN